MRSIKINKKRGVKYLMLASVLASSALAVLSPETVLADELAISTLMADQRLLTSGISYLDYFGKQQVLPIPESTEVTINTTSTEVVVKFDNQTHRLVNAKEMAFSNITVTNKASFYTDSITKMTIDNVTFSTGANIEAMNKLKSLKIADSFFGGNDYSLAVKSSPYLTDFSINSSEFLADLQIYTNKALRSVDIIDSVLQDDARQISNLSTYRTNYINTRFERFNGSRIIGTGKRASSDTFYLNEDASKTIGKSQFKAAQKGNITYQDGYSDDIHKIDIGAYTSITSIKASGDKLTIKLQNGHQTVINNPRDITFNNVDIKSSVNLTSKALRLEAVTFIDCRTEVISVGNSETLEKFEIHRSEVSQKQGYINLFKNTVLTRLVMQESSIKGTAGYTSIHNNLALEEVIMNDNYYDGYVYVQNSGGATLQFSNCKFKEYLAANNVIEGVADKQPIGFNPVIHAMNMSIQKGDAFDPMEGVTATDVEDGDLTKKITVTSYVNEFVTGDYPVIYEVTDSHGNVTELTITVTVIV